MENELIIVIVSVILGGIVTYFVTKHFREKKSLAYELICESSLINVSSKIKDKIRIEWDGAPIEDVSSFKVKLINDGNVVIKTQPILFSFEEGSWIVDWDYVTKPEKEFGHIEKIEKDETPNEVKIVVDLMNPKEEIEFNFLTADSKTDLLNLYAKGENLKFHKIIGLEARLEMTFKVAIAVAIAVFILYLLTMFINFKFPYLEASVVLILSAVTIQILSKKINQLKSKK